MIWILGDNETSIPEIVNMDYYRVQENDGIMPGATSLHIADTANLLNMASDSYASDYWNIPYTNGLSPMKQIEGKSKMEHFL